MFNKQDLSLYKENRFDFIHDSQKTFMILMKVLAYPGTIMKLPDIDLLFKEKKFNYLLICGLTLLDLEVNYTVIGDDQFYVDMLKDYLKINTNAAVSNIENAHFIFNISPGDIEEFEKLNTGTLDSPHNSATIFYLVDNISKKYLEDSLKIKLSGPGLKTGDYIYIDGITQDEINEWKNININYPMGIDIYLITANGNICGIPRSIKIEIVEGE